MEKLAVIGLGLIGGSVGLAVRARAPQLIVVGHDRDPRAGDQARARGAVSDVAATADAAVRGADVVVVAVPMDAIPGVCERIAPAVAPAAAVTDAGSAKAAVVAAAERVLGDRFVGGHPMAGSERHGIEAATDDLYVDAWWVLTPTPRTSAATYGSVAGLVATLGAQAVAVDPAMHDALVARLSHLPQLVASALVEVAAAAGDREALLGLAAGGFRDTTRIASSPPDLWVAILQANRAAVLEALAGLEGRLRAVGEMMAGDRWSELGAFLGRARTARSELFVKPVYGGEPVALTLMIPDRPGVLAEVTTAAGALGANIEDLRIVHSTEGGRGRLELVVSGEAPAGMLARELAELGYRVDSPPIGLEI